MKKRGVTYNIFKAALITSGLLLGLLILAITALYIPPVQKFAVREVCKSIRERNGFDIEAEAFKLRFPLRIEINGLCITKDSTFHAKGGKIGLEFAFLPLLRGMIRTTYIQLEEISIDSGEMIPGVRIAGNAGYSRAETGCIDIKERLVGLQLLQLKESEMEFSMSDTAVNRDKETSGWIFKLQRGGIEDCKAKINIPNKTLDIGFHIGGLLLEEGEVDLGRKSYGIAALEISNTAAAYNHGGKEHEGRLPKNIRATDLRCSINNALFSPENSHIEVKEMSFIQPGGIEVCSFRTTMMADSTYAEIKELGITTGKGSNITATAYLPWSAIKHDGNGKGSCEIALSITPGELNTILSREVLNPDYGKFTAAINAAGNATRTEIGKIEIGIPEFGYLKAKAHACNLYDTDRITAGIDIEEAAGYMGKLTKSDTAVKASGVLSYAAGCADGNINIKAGKGDIKCLAKYYLHGNRYAANIKATDLDLSGIVPDFPLKYRNIGLQADIYIDAREKSGSSTVEITVPNGNETSRAEIEFGSTPDNTFIKAKNGDLILAGEMNCGYSKLAGSIEKARRMFAETLYTDGKQYNLTDYTNVFPNISLSLECGRGNMLYPFITSEGFDIESIAMKTAVDRRDGIGMDCRILGFEKGKMMLDTAVLYARQSNEKIIYVASVHSDAGNRRYNATLNGNIFKDSVTTDFVLRDRNDEAGMKLGATGVLNSGGIDITFNREAILFGYDFVFNGNSFLKIHKNRSAEADISVRSGNDAGIHISTTADKDAKQNINIGLSNIDIQKMTEMFPYSPDIAGRLNLDLRLKLKTDGMCLNGNARMDSLKYEGRDIGNAIVDAVYSTQEGYRHLFDARLNSNGKDVLQLKGVYTAGEGENYIEGDISVTELPVGLAGIFIKEELITLDGYANGNINAKGALPQLVTNGEIRFDSVYIYIPLSGTRLHLADTPVRIKENRILFDEFNVYTRENNPFKIEGYADISNLSSPRLNLKMNAKGYELVNSRKAKGSMLYGKLFADIDAIVNGCVEELHIGGNATLLGKSDITYILQGSPIGSGKELDGIVEFVNFQDTAEVMDRGKSLDAGNISVGLVLRIEEGARINADFDNNSNSHLKLRGGGNLNMTYEGGRGMSMTGSYTIDEGVLKYELPIIPLKTFDIESGSKVIWNGNIQNPTLNILAVEKITTSVTFDDNSIQPVTFTVGIKLTNTLSDMGLSFTIAAPENAIVQEQLNSLDEETLNKYAITMLITGTYIGGANGMNVSNALTSFLDAKINELAGSTMKSVNVSIGINDAQEAGGGSVYKNYTFSLSKRLWNDRLTIVIGGEVNSGNAPDGGEAFLNNVSLEWKLGNNGNRFLRLFYDRNFESLLEGEIIETGIGYAYKCKLENLKELFITESKKVGRSRKGKL